MRCSVGLPTCMEGMMYPVPFASVDEVIETAKLAEKLGYHSVWGNDHMTTQQYVQREFSQPPNFWEPLVLYAYLAAETDVLCMGTGILVTPMRRDIVVLAKQIATVDHLTRGRLLIGVGVGAYREEFEALQPGFKAHRGNMLEESVQALQHLFTERSASWSGEYYRFEDVEMYPKPYQEEIPFYFGGNNPNAVRRAAQYGLGWLPAGMPEATLRENISRLRHLAAENGRDGAKIDVAPQLIAYVGKNREQAVERFRSSQIYKHLVSLRASTLKDQAEEDFVDANLIGAPADLVEKIQRLGEIGVTHLCGTYFTANTVAELHEQLQIFAEEVLPYIQ